MTTPGRGGYQPPTHPAPVGMPGALSKRTDGGPADKQPVRNVSGLPYGEQQTLRGVQQQAPMAATPGGDQPAPLPQVDASRVVPLGAPTGRPGEPVTHGAAAGPGPGPEALGLPSTDPGVDDLRGMLPTLELLANQPGSSQGLRQFVRRARAAM